MKKSIKKIASAFYSNFVTKPKLVLDLCSDKLFLSSESYYPELSGERKTKVRIIADNMIHILHHCEINYFYFLYGFDIKKFRNKNDYIPYKKFMEMRNRMNGYPHNYDLSILRNKFLFSLFGKEFGLPIIQNKCIIENGVIINNNSPNQHQFFLKVLEQELNVELFIKSLTGECGEDIFELSKFNGIFYLNGIEEELSNIEKIINNGVFVVQDKIQQHKSLSSIYAKSVNTMRFMTVKNSSNNIIISPCVLRVGTNGSVVDNWAKGGLVIPINNDGRLEKYGFYKPGEIKMGGGKTTMHPDTHTLFEGYKIPFFKESIEMAIKSHKYLNVHSIGWDIAFTENGAIIIEGNDNWEVTLPQLCEPFKEFIYTNFKN